MTFSPKQRQMAEAVTTIRQGEPVEIVEEYKYLRKGYYNFSDSIKECSECNDFNSLLSLMVHLQDVSVLEEHKLSMIVLSFAGFTISLYKSETETMCLTLSTYAQKSLKRCRG